MAVSLFRTALPLVHVRSPIEVAATHPSFFAAEVLFHVLFAATFTQWVKGRNARLVWLAALSSGASVELLTLMCDQVGNFYHSLSTISLFGLREPAYMLFGCYVWCQTTPLWIARSVNTGVWAETALAWLIGDGLWGILDLVGLRNLWWSWHNTEPMYAERSYGVPIASTFWFGSTAGALAYATRAFVKSAPTGKLSPIIFALCLGVFSSLVLMTVPFSLFYVPLVAGIGVPAQTVLFMFRCICVLTVLRSFVIHRGKLEILFHDAFLLLQVVFYLVVMVLIAWHFERADIVTQRTALGQPVAPSAPECDEVETSFMGLFHRQRYVCASTVNPSRDQYTRVENAAQPFLRGDWPMGAWNTLIGLSREQRSGDGWLQNIIIHTCIVCSICFVCAFVRVQQRTKQKSS